MVGTEIYESSVNLIAMMYASIRAAASQASVYVCQQRLPAKLECDFL